MLVIENQGYYKADRVRENDRDGQDGVSGNRGANGIPIRLILKSTKLDSIVLIRAIAANPYGVVKECVFNPKLGNLTLINQGGNGGNGGEGAWGSDGLDETASRAVGFGGRGEKEVMGVMGAMEEKGFYKSVDGFCGGFICT